MPSQREVINALFGAWRLIRFDAGGMNWFDFSTGGFWRSFFAIAIAAPFLPLLVILNDQAATPPVDYGERFFITAIIYGGGSIAIPIIMFPVTKLLGLTRNYIPAIVAYNWVTVPQMAIQTLASAVGLVSEGLAMTALFAALVYILIIEWFVFRTALQTTAMNAVGIVLLLETIGIIINFMAHG